MCNKLVQVFSYLTLMVISANGQQFVGSDCSQEIRINGNLCGEQLFFVGRHSRPYPLTEQQLDRQCSETTRLIRCVEQFTNRCREGIHRPTARIMLSTARRTQRKYCDLPQKRRELLSMASCGNAVKDPSIGCMDEFLMNLGQANFANRLHKVPQGCCSYYKLKSCVLREADRQPSCSQTRSQQFEQYMDAMAGNTLKLICGQYDQHSGRCSRLPPLPVGPHIERAANIFSGFSKLLI